MRFKRKKGKKISKAKKKVYDGIEFDSGLEVYAYKALKAAKIKFKYEPTSFIINPQGTRHFRVHKKTPKNAYHGIKTNNNLKISYTPDFIVHDEEGNIIHIIETKGFANERFSVVVKLFYSYAIKWLPYLKNYFIPSNQKAVDETIKIILEDD